MIFFLFGEKKMHPFAAQRFNFHFFFFFEFPHLVFKKKKRLWPTRSGILAIKNKSRDLWIQRSSCLKNLCANQQTLWFYFRHSKTISRSPHPFGGGFFLFFFCSLPFFFFFLRFSFFLRRSSYRKGKPSLTLFLQPQVFQSYKA